MLNKVSLNTIGLNRIGLNRIGKPSRGSSGRPYIDPEVLSALKAVCICYGKSNDDPDRAIVKNLVDPDNPFVISNAAYKLNSGYGKYEEDFTSWNSSSYVSNIRHDSFDVNKDGTSVFVLYKNIDSSSSDTPSFKIKVSNLINSIIYAYINDSGVRSFFNIKENGEYILPKSYNSLTPTTTWIGFRQEPDVNCECTITQIPSYQGAFVTDGVDDLITSTKTVQEMDITDEVTVVSMIHQIDLNSTYTIATTNYIENSNSREHVRSDVYNYGKTGIYGYSASLINNTKSDIKNILGDEADYYVKSTNSLQTIFDAKFSVVGRISELTEASQVAWYWTIIANKVLTTDQINQVIAYFNLDRTLNPDILCNTIKQGITNENHAEFGDKLIDFSGNGRDIQLNNIAWKGDSGIGKYAADFTSWTTPNGVQKTSDTVKITTEYTENWVAYFGPNTFKFMKVLISGIPDGGALHFFRTTADGGDIKMVNGINEIPEFTNTRAAGFYIYVPLGFDWSNLVIEQIPSHAGALCLDGVNDFGKVTGMPIYKDYTIVVDYERLKIDIGVDSDSAILSKSELTNLGAFMFNIISSSGDKVSYSFGRRNIINADDTIRKIFYQSKYINDGQDINIESTFVDSDKLWLGTYRDSDYRFIEAAIYSLMSFPYSMSEFLIERQLKKHKLGTLYPDMVEFRPVIKANNDYEIVYTAIIKPDNWQEISIGDYVTVGKSVAIQIKLNLPLEVTNVSSNSLADVSFYKEETGDNVYTIYGRLLDGKSPQKINITIDEYIRFEDIVQPYPVLLRFKDENGNEVSWGGKFKVGSTITRIGSAADSNLLPNIYNIFGLLLNGNQVTSSKVIVEKTMVFKVKSAYIFDNNEPKCILSPRLLRIPNSSYKILGHIPDISGHGNHGKINNSAYAEGSGVNEDGSYQFDGVDDFVTIPTIVGGKQVLMKMNWQNRTGLLYDQRKNGSSIDGFAILNVNSNNSIAYNSRNTDGETYIDGILNKNIVCPQLYKITHSITIINQLANKEEVMSPTIGSDTTHKIYFSQMSLYDFMLFDDISTEDKIKELNEYVGIEGNTDDLFNETN